MMTGEPEWYHILLMIVVFAVGLWLYDRIPGRKRPRHNKDKRRRTD